MMHSKWPIFCLIILLLAFPAQGKAEAKLSLKECFQLALNYSDVVAISKEEIQLARARYSQALGEVLPQITFQVSELLQDPSGNSGGDVVGQTFTQLSRSTGAFNLQQVLFRGFQEIEALKIGHLNQKRSVEDEKNVERLLFQDVVIAFYTIALIERDIETDELIVSVIQQRVKELRERVELGKSREGELTQEQAALALLEGDLEREKGQRAVAYEMMSFLTGKVPMPPIAVADPVKIPDRPLAFFLEQTPNRPDLMAAQTTVDIAEKNIKVARGNFLPRVDLEANVYPFRPGFQSNILWDVEFRGEVPLFKYQNFGIYKEAKVLAKQAEFEAQNQLRVARKEVKEAFENYQSSRAQYRRFRHAVGLAYKNFQLQNKDFSFGRATNLDVLTAQRTWLSSLEERNRSEVQLWLDWTNLQIASGVMP